VQIARCQDVVFRDCEFRLGDTPIEIEDSTVLLTTCDVVPVGPFPPLPFYPYTNYGHTATRTAALDLVDSDVSVIGSILRARATIPGQNQPAVPMVRSTLRVGPASIVRGASSSGGYWFAYWADDPTGCAVHIDPRSTVEGVNFASQPQPTPTAIDATYHGRVVAGYWYGVSVAGPSDGFALLVLSNLSLQPVATPFGEVLLDLATAFAVDLVYLPPPDGYHTWWFQCPSQAPVATPFVFQSLTLSPTGQFDVTIPSPLTVGWQHGVSPP
jgi:hypothetical protein